MQSENTVELSVWAWRNVECLSPKSSSKASQLFGERTGKWKLTIHEGTWKLADTRTMAELGSGNFQDSQFVAKSTSTNGANITFFVCDGSIDIFLKGGGLTFLSKGHRTIARHAELAFKGASLPKSEFLVSTQNPFVFDGTFVGGAGVPFEVGEEVSILCNPEGFTFSQGQVGLWKISFDGLIGYQAVGQGAFQTGGGWIGGGFGVMGALQGAAFASVMNLITTRTEIDCMFRLVYAGTDASFRVWSHTPQDLEIGLSGVRNYLETGFGSNAIDVEKPRTEEQLEVSTNIRSATELEKYWHLFEKGAITKDEYESAKKKLLGA